MVSPFVVITHDLRIKGADRVVVLEKGSGGGGEI